MKEMMTNDNAGRTLGGGVPQWFTCRVETDGQGAGQSAP